MTEQNLDLERARAVLAQNKPTDDGFSTGYCRALLDELQAARNEIPVLRLDIRNYQAELTAARQERAALLSRSSQLGLELTVARRVVAAAKSVDSDRVRAPGAVFTQDYVGKVQLNALRSALTDYRQTIASTEQVEP